MQDTLLFVLSSTITQLLIIFGVFFVFGFVLSWIQRQIQHQYQMSVGWKGILWTAWIGTPVHELGHLFFAWLFRHRIDHISLFRPDRESGSLGHVTHSYSKLSLYQRIGLFFIGAAPMITGPIVLALLLYILVPNAKVIFLPLIDSFSSIAAFKGAFLGVTQLFILENLRSWQFWLFLYLSFCISSHLAPSKADLRQMWKGLLWLTIIIAGLNLLALILEFDMFALAERIHQYLGIFTALFTYATVLSVIHLLLARVVFAAFSKDWKLRL